MNWFVAEKNTVAEAYRTAGIKARDDADEILLSAGFSPLEVICPADRANMNSVNKLLIHMKLKSIWSKALSKAAPGDNVVIQFPAVNHTIFLDGVIKKLISKGVRVTALIHDLELLRLSLTSEDAAKSWRLKKEELSVLHLFTKIIVHNNSMLDYVHGTLGIPKNRLVSLEIFDYLVKKDVYPEAPDDFRSVIIAGNLSRNKSEYVYDLPDSFRYELYGPNYTGKADGNVSYHGSFPPDELPRELCGGFGLVWDGTSADTCNGVWGEYLKYNNPHKTSLYLASGIPVIIWDKAALADFVLSNGCGIAVSSLNDIQDAVNALTADDYKIMRENAYKVSRRLRDGAYTKEAVKKCFNL